MAEMTEQQALAVLQQIKGLRDAFLGFNHVIDAVGPLITELANAKKTIAALQKTREEIKGDIERLDKERHGYQKEADEQLSRLKTAKQHLATIQAL